MSINDYDYDMENKNTVIWVIVIIIIIIAAIFGWQYYSKGNGSGENNGNATTTEDEVIPQVINAKHQFANGKHIVAGEVDLPTPCHILNTIAVVGKSQPEQVTIEFVSSSQADFCAQVITSARFKVEFNAGENAVIDATWNGKPADLRLTPATAGENLENFEVFIKA